MLTYSEMPLLHDKHGYHFGRIAGDPLKSNQFTVAGKTYEIIETTSTGRGQYDCYHVFREVGGKETYRLSMRKLVEKLTGKTI